MKITALIHLFPPEHCAGSETTLHAALRALANRGHEIRVICANSKTAPYEIDGISVVRPPRRGQDTWLQEYVRGSDLLVTHLDLTSQAMNLAMAMKIPLVHFVHNDAQLMCWRVDARVPYKNALTVYNSRWLAAKPSSYYGHEMPKEWLAPSIVVHPVVEREHYECERGTKITLVNPTPGKGVETFKALARLMPNREFLAVEGGYGEQMIVSSDGPIKHGQLRAGGNIEWMAHTPDIRNVFRKTKVLLMPSDYESFGRVGVEAACCGIPTIAHPTPGLKEAFGDAGIFIDRNEVAAWFNEVERLMTDDVYYRKRSQIVLEMASKIDPESEFDRLEKAFIETAERWKNKESGAVKMWTSDRWIYRMQDGSYKAMDNPGRIPRGAVTQIAGKGTEIPEHIAKENGWIGPDREEAKAVSEPEENKALSAPQETKAKGRKKAEAA
jgi:glycosyltransferase involved in cell wall biosynthesis